VLPAKALLLLPLLLGKVPRERRRVLKVLPAKALLLLLPLQRAATRSTGKTGERSVSLSSKWATRTDSSAICVNTALTSVAASRRTEQGIQGIIMQSTRAAFWSTSEDPGGSLRAKRVMRTNSSAKSATMAQTTPPAERDTKRGTAGKAW
jgi:hypothetical protein